MSQTESSLTTPEDRNPEKRWKPDQRSVVLTEEQVDEAMKELSVTSFVEKFPKIDRTYADPPIVNQLIGLISFIPAKGAKPNDNGVYGFAKLRGNYASELEANQRAEHIIRHLDSYHPIYHTYVGRPFPLTTDSKYSAETKEIDIRKEMTDTISTDVQSKRQREKAEVETIKERERRLLEESDRASKDLPPVIDPLDQYIELSVKKAQLSWNYIEHRNKMAEIETLIKKARVSLAEMDEKDPTLKETYFARYADARKQAGISESAKDTQDNFIKFMVEDPDLGF